MQMLRRAESLSAQICAVAKEDGPCETESGTPLCRDVGAGRPEATWSKKELVEHHELEILPKKTMGKKHPVRRGPLHGRV